MDIDEADSVKVNKRERDGVRGSEGREMEMFEKNEGRSGRGGEETNKQTTCETRKAQMRPLD